MRLLPLTTLLPLLLTLTTGSPQVETEYITTVDCTRKTKVGDTINVHYRGTLASDGTQFDASYDRGQPLSFKVGQGMVIKG